MTPPTVSTANQKSQYHPLDRADRGRVRDSSKAITEADTESTDVSADGTRFLMIKGRSQTAAPTIVVAQNGLEELKRILPPK